MSEKTYLLTLEKSGFIKLIEVIGVKDIEHQR